MKRLLIVIGLVLGLFFPCFAEDKPCPIVMFHHIREATPKMKKAARDLSCEPERFKSFLDWLERNGYKTITFKDMMFGKIPEKPVILTFDDGARTQWEAFVELRKRGMKGVFFIVYNNIGSRGYLNDVQLMAMDSSGMEIGSHTIHHYRLTQVSQATLLKEVNDSKALLEERLRVQIISFAYPYGLYNAKVLEVMRRSNYWYARSTDEGVSTFGLNPSYRLKIFYVHNRTKELNFGK